MSRRLHPLFRCLRPWLMGALLLGASTGGAAAQALGHGDAWTLAQWQAAHPEDKARMDALARRVEAPARPVAAPPRRPVRIAAVLPARQVSDYWRRNMRAMEARLRALGMPYILSRYDPHARVDHTLQTDYLRQALAEDPDYLIFTLDALHHRHMIDSLLVRDRPRLILQNVTTPLRAWDGAQPFLYVGFDHREGARRLARWFRDHTEGPVPFALLYFGRGLISEARGGGFLEALQDVPRFQLKSAFYTEGQVDRARDAALTALHQDPALRLIYACATDVAHGAVEAVRLTGHSTDGPDAKGRPPVLVNGFGGGASELEALRQGALAVTVMRMNDEAAIATAEAIALAETGHADEVPTVFAGRMVVVDRHTAPTTLKRLRERAFRLSGGAP